MTEVKVQSPGVGPQAAPALLGVLQPAGVRGTPSVILSLPRAMTVGGPPERPGDKKRETEDVPRAAEVHGSVGSGAPDKDDCQDWHGTVIGDLLKQRSTSPSPPRGRGRLGAKCRDRRDSKTSRRSLSPRARRHANGAKGMDSRRETPACPDSRVALLRDYDEEGTLDEEEADTGEEDPEVTELDYRPAALRGSGTSENQTRVEEEVARPMAGRMTVPDSKASAVDPGVVSPAKDTDTGTRTTKVLPRRWLKDMYAELFPESPGSLL